MIISHRQATMAASGARKPARVLQCPVCTKRYQHPRLLPCFHTLCLGCLTPKLLTDSFPCPKCHTKINRPPGGVDAFPVDAYVESQLLLTEDNVAVVCDVCQKNDVTRKCVQCEQFLCEDCSTIHSRLTVTRSHTLLMWNSLKGSQQKAEVLVKERCCNIHAGEQLRFFCNDCRSVICRDCKLTTHQPHSAEDVSSVSQGMWKSMQKVSLLCQNQLQPKLEKAVSEAEKHKAGFQASTSKMLAEVKKRAAEIKNFVDKHVKDVEKQASAHTSNVEDTLNTMKGMLASLEMMHQRLSPEQVSGCPPDTINLFVNVQRFFGVQAPRSSSSSSSGSGALAAHSTRSSFGSFGGENILGPHPAVDDSKGRFEVFTQEQWKRTLKLSSSTTVEAEPPPQTFQFSRFVPYETGTRKLSVPPDSSYKASVRKHIGTIKSVLPTPSRDPFFGGPARSGSSQDIQTELSQIQNNLMMKGGAVPVTTGFRVEKSHCNYFIHISTV